jgi:hypothetical protein
MRRILWRKSVAANGASRDARKRNMGCAESVAKAAQDEISVMFGQGEDKRPFF